MRLDINIPPNDKSTWSCYTFCKVRPTSFFQLLWPERVREWANQEWGSHTTWNKLSINLTIKSQAEDSSPYENCTGIDTILHIIRARSLGETCCGGQDGSLRTFCRLEVLWLIVVNCRLDERGWGGRCKASPGHPAGGCMATLRIVLPHHTTVIQLWLITNQYMFNHPYTIRVIYG